MDTRSKILTLAAASRLAGPLAVVTGFFDTIGAVHVRGLRSARDAAPGAKLVVAILPLENALLKQRARAELAAALSLVDYVLIAEQPGAGAEIAALKPVQVARLETAEERRNRQLKDHVRIQRDQL